MRRMIIFSAALAFLATAAMAQQCYKAFPPGDDPFSTTSNVGIANNPQCANPQPIRLTGTFTVRRDDPFRPPDNRCEIPTEIVAMDQRDGTGQIRLTIQAPPNRSLGQIKQQTAGLDFPATSFFKVLFEVTGVPGVPGTLFNKPTNPKQMSSVINGIPPFGQVYENPDCIPLFRREDPEPRQPVAWLTAAHTPQPPQCTGQVCGTFTPDCNPDIRPCYCFSTAEGGGNCSDDFFCAGRQPCNRSSDCPSGQLCYVNTCCGEPVCGPTNCTGQIQGDDQAGADAATATGKSLNEKAANKSNKK